MILINLLMKKLLITFLILFSKLLLSQTEQISIDFFASELLPKFSKVKVFYDGKVIPKSQYQQSSKDYDEETIIENILWDYYLCKKDLKKISIK